MKRIAQKELVPGRGTRDTSVWEITPPGWLRVEDLKSWRECTPKVVNPELIPGIETENVPPQVIRAQWQSFATLATGQEIRSIETKWKVPPAPVNNGQTIFLFCGIEVKLKRADAGSGQSGDHILQPVLQFRDGKWSVACWFAGRSTQVAVRTLITDVQSDVTLTGIIKRINVNGSVAFNCQFDGIEDASLTVEMPEPPFQAVETLEVYAGNNGELAYPLRQTTLSNIKINDQDVEIESKDITNHEKSPTMVVGSNRHSLRILWQKRTRASASAGNSDAAP